LRLLIVCAGEPTLQSVAKWATAAQQRSYPGGGSPVFTQRISDWSLGKRVPQRWESFEPVVRVLIREALRRKTPPTKPGMYELGRWRQRWSEARTASDDAAGRSPRTGSASSCPYQGLAAFQATDQARFFGRTRAIEELVALITQAHATDPGIVLLTGPSGAGKSSLLSAGLLPAASSGALDTIGGGTDGWVAARMTPGKDPMAELRRCLDHPDVAGRTEGAPVLIVVDQSEEIFAAGVSPQARAEFLDVVHTMCQPSMSTPTVVVMGIRSDALGHCVELAELVGAVKSRCMVLGQMNDAELREVVTGPTKMARLGIEAGLIDLILHDVAAEENPAETVRLPLLSHVLAGTWERRKGVKLTIAGYKSVGGLRGSVEATGEDAWEQLDEEQRGIARRMLLRLVTIGDAGYDSCRRESQRELLARFPDAENAADVLETLTAARLLTIDGGDVVFTHEIVLRAWPRLATWIDDDRTSAPIRQRAESDAAAWINNGRKKCFLQSGARLDGTLAILANSQDVDPFVAEFSEASLRHQRRVTRTKQGAAVLVIILAVVATSAAVVALRQRSTMSRQYKEAVFNQVLGAADARQLNDPSLSAQLSMVAHQLRPNDQVRSRLLATQNAPLATQLTGHNSGLYAVTFSPDGNLLASASWDNTVRLWDTSDPNSPEPVGQPLRGHTGSVNSVAFSPDGKTLASSSRDKTVRLWDVTTRTDVKELTTPLTGDGTFYWVAFSPDGRTLAAAGDDRTVRLWDVTDIRAPRAGVVLTGHTGPVRAVAFSPNGRILASAGNDRTVRLWDVADPVRVQQVGPPLTGFTNVAYAVAFDPAGSLLAASGRDGVIQLWNVGDPAHPTRVADPLPAHNDASWSVAFSPDGTILTSASDDGTAKLWNLLDPAHPVALGQSLADSNGGLTSVTFHSDGRHLATGSASGAIALWTLPTGVVPNHVGSIGSPAFSADGTVMATASDNVVQLWTNDNHLTRAATLRLPDNSEGGYGYQARVDPSGRILATALGSAPTVLWDISDITKPIEFSTLPTTARHTNIVAFSPDGRTVATAGDDYTVQLWDIAEPRRPQRLSEPLTGFTGPFLSGVMFSPDGRTVVASNADRTVCAWDITDRDHPKLATAAITGNTAAFASPAISPDSKTLAIGGQDQTIRLWDITDPRHATPIGNPLHSPRNVAQVVFSPDGKTLASSGDRRDRGPVDHQPPQHIPSAAPCSRRTRRRQRAEVLVEHHPPALRCQAAVPWHGYSQHQRVAGNRKIGQRPGDGVAVTAVAPAVWATWILDHRPTEDRRDFLVDSGIGDGNAQLDRAHDRVGDNRRRAGSSLRQGSPRWTDGHV
jgi:WD40 repeat protein